MMILFNDTSTVEANPGCALTMAGLVSLLDQRELARRPLGFCYDQYRRARHQLPLNFLRIFRTLMSDREFRRARTVVINGEGTIHHEEKGAHVLLIILALSRLLGKKVFVVNCSIQQLSKRNLRLLKLAHGICVREKLSQAYLAESGIDSTFALDCAFLADTNTPATHLIPREEARPVCIFTPGVLLEHKRGNEAFLRGHFERIREMGYDPVYLQVQEKEDKDVTFWASMGGKVVRRDDYQAEEIFSVLRESDLVISGRYHIIIFTIMVRKPFLVLETNTWKITGMLQAMDRQLGTSMAGIGSDPSKPVKPNDPGALDLDSIRQGIRQSYGCMGAPFQSLQ